MAESENFYFVARKEQIRTMSIMHTKNRRDEIWMKFLCRK